MSAGEGASQLSSAEQANEWAVRANKRTEEQMAQKSTRRLIDFTVSLTYVRWLVGWLDGR